MGAKRWQLEEKDNEIRILKEQLKEAIRALDFYIDFFAHLDGGKHAERAKTKIKLLEEETK